MGRWITRNGAHIYIPDEDEILEQEQAKDRQIKKNKEEADKKNEREPIAWITVNGAHVAIYDSNWMDPEMKERYSKYIDDHSFDNSLDADEKTWVEALRKEKYGNTKKSNMDSDFDKKEQQIKQSASDVKQRQLEDRIKSLPKEVQEPVSEAYKWLDKNLGISNPEADIVIDEKRGSGDRMHYDPMDKKIHIARTELKSFIKDKDGCADTDASDIVHEYMHSAQMKYIYKNSYKAKEQESAKKAFVKDISNRTGINLTQAKIKELFGNYATKDKNEEFITMAVQKYYNMQKLGFSKSNISTKKQLSQERWAVGNAILEYLKERM